MKITKKDLIFLVLILILYYFHFNKKKETFTNPGFDSNGNLVVPGSLTVKGDTSMNGNATINGKWLTVNGQAIFRKMMHIRGPKGWSYINHKDGNIYLRGNVVIDQPGYNNLTVGGNTSMNGNATINGKWLTVNGQAIFRKMMHIRGPKGWSYINHKDGNIYLRGNVVIDQPGANNLNVYGTSKFYGPTWFKNQKRNAWSHMNWPDGNIYLRGNVILDGLGNSNKNLTVLGNTTVAGKPVLKNGDQVRIKLQYYD